MTNFIYRSTVSHARHLPISHHFKYPVVYYGFDLDDLENLNTDIWWFGYNKHRFLSIHDMDYLNDTDGSIKDKLATLMTEQGIHGLEKAILITSPRYMRYVFNPVNFYFCYDTENRCIGVITEVNNTFSDKHVYVMPVASNEWPLTLNISKAFHVSPFNDMEGEYQFTFHNPLESLNIDIQLIKEEQLHFYAGFKGSAEPIQSSTYRQTLPRHLLTPWLSIPRIHWEAFKLFLAKKLPVFDRPTPASPMTIRHAKPGISHHICQKLLFKMFRQMNHNILKVTLPDGKTHLFGNPNSENEIDLQINDHRFFTKTVIGGHVGFGEAYVDGYWDSTDPVQLLIHFIENTNAVKDGNFLTATVQRWRDSLLHKNNKNSVENSQRNIADHYDLSNDFYQLFLDSSMMYSSAMYDKQHTDISAAQHHKIDRIIEKARITSNDHVLEIGCGWGTFAIEAAQKTGCKVTGITLSKEQLSFAQQRVNAAGLNHLIDLQLIDYRHVAGTYDKIVSIEMLEAVGHEYFGTFFQSCDKLLKRDGIIVLQVITIPDQKYDAYRKSCDWIQKYIFPGGHLPSLEILTKTITKHSDFVVEHLENIALSYAQTLKFWRDNFDNELEAIYALGFDHHFERMWRYYLIYCEAGFASKTLGDLQLVLSRPYNKQLIESDADIR